MVQRHSWKADSCSFEKFSAPSCHCGNSNFCFHKILLLEHILSQTDSIYILKPNFLIQFIIIFPCERQFRNLRLLPSGFTDKNVVCMYHFPMNVTSTDRLILLFLLSTHNIRWTERLSDIPVTAGYGTASLCDKFRMFRESTFVSRRRAITKWRGDTSI
jgi:hypothetical protein